MTTIPTLAGGEIAELREAIRGTVFAPGDEAGAQRALDAAGTVLAGSQDRAAMRYLNAKRALSGCKDAGS